MHRGLVNKGCLDNCASVVLLVAMLLFMYGIQRIDSTLVDEQPLPTDTIVGRWRGVDSRGEYTEVNWHIDIYPATTHAHEATIEINDAIGEALAMRRCGSTEAYQQVNMHIQMVVADRDAFYVQGVGVQMLCGDGYRPR